MISCMDAKATICSSYPNTFINGQTADANQVMANFNCAALTSGSTIAGPTFTGTVISTAIANSANISTSTITGGSLTFSAAGAVASNTVQNFIGNTNSDNTALIEFKTGQAAKVGAYFINNGAAVGDTIQHIWFQYGGAVKAGSITSVGTTVTYGSASDARLKNIAVQQKNYRSVIRDMWIGDFNWKADGTPGFGILAQQAYRLFPYPIVKPADPKGTWEADYGKLAPLALWGVKDLYREVGFLWSIVGSLGLWNLVLTFLIWKRRQ